MNAIVLVLTTACVCVMCRLIYCLPYCILYILVGITVTIVCIRNKKTEG